ncbi:hypothetical protein ACFQ07_04665, partial [Actinomadura adrarensis]
HVDDHLRELARRARAEEVTALVLGGTFDHARIDSLDLSWGPLTDKGGEALLNAPAFRALKRLDLRHHRMSEEMRDRVRRTFSEAGVHIETQPGLGG